MLERNEISLRSMKAQEDMREREGEKGKDRQIDNRNVQSTKQIKQQQQPQRQNKNQTTHNKKNIN